jgi:hypothetical protein
MGAEWHVLTWDSDFFGIPIARIDLTAGDAAAIAAAEGEAADAGITCLYGELDPCAADAIDLVQRLGYRLMEVALELEHPTNVVHDPPPTTSRVRAGSVEDIPALAEHIAAAATWSRYAVDPRFGLSAAVTMHRAWVERAAGPEPDRMLLCTRARCIRTSGSTEPSSSEPAFRVKTCRVWTLATRPGDALVWDFRLMHAAYGSTAPRRQIALNFCEVPPPADPGAAHAQRTNAAHRARDDLTRPASSLLR